MQNFRGWLGGSGSASLASHVRYDEVDDQQEVRSQQNHHLWLNEFDGKSNRDQHVYVISLMVHNCVN